MLIVHIDENELNAKIKELSRTFKKIGVQKNEMNENYIIYCYKGLE